LKPWKTEISTLAQWEFHDLLFHARSRDGRHSNLYGGTYPWFGWVESPPACKPLTSPDKIVLEEPTAAGSEMSTILERRRSIREYFKTPIRLSQLSEFLFHSARVVEFVPGEDEITRRPHPSSGARYPLEVYVVANFCDGLQRGVYHYDRRGHTLSMLLTPAALIDQVLDDLRTYATRQTNWMPQVAIVFTARFERASWKYQSVTYALILKEVGALMQTMYIVATAMGLAPCAVGGGDSDLFARITSSDYYAESAVGEFLLGLPA
jgi:SagB-type dehydrogenase family enzyme